MQDALVVVRKACVIGLVALVACAGGACTGKGEKRSNTILDSGVDDRELRMLTAEKANEKVLESWDEDEAMSLIIIDPRPAEQWRAQRIAGARNLSLADIRTGALQVPNWDRSDLVKAKAKNANEPRSNRLADYDEILIYGTDPASATPLAMAKKLKGLNYTNVYILDGGLYAWRAAGGDVVGTDTSDAALMNDAKTPASQ
jgi:rhodanese-related sulfurtransferase